MKILPNHIGWFAVALTLWVGVRPAQAQGTALSYQGRLNGTNGSPATGLYDFQFRVFDAAIGGAQQGSTISSNAMPVTNGLFAAALDFGSSVFLGANRWLDVQVRSNGAAAFSAFGARQQFLSSPYAIRSLQVANGAITTASLADGSVTGAKIAAGAVSQPQIANGAITTAALADGAVTAAKIAPGAVSQLGAPDGSPANAVQVDTNGLVGIGTTSPRAGLEIAAGTTLLAPQLLSQIPNGQGDFTNLAYANAVAFSSNLLAVAAWGDNAVTLIDVSFSTFPLLLSSFKDGQGAFTNLARPSAVALSGNLLVVAGASDNAVTLVDVSDPANPRRLSELRDGIGGFNELAGPTALALSGSLLAVASDDNAVTLVNISDPANPSLYAVLKDGQFGFNDLQYPDAVAIRGNLMAVAAYSDNAVTLVDISNPAAPSLRATLKHGVGGYTNLGLTTSVAISGNLLAIGGRNDDASIPPRFGGLTLVDISNPGSPILRSRLQQGLDGANFLTDPASVVFASNNLLAVEDQSGGSVSLFDVSNPSKPVLRGMARNGFGGFRGLQQPISLAVKGNVLAVAGYYDNGVTLMDISTVESVGLVTTNWVGIGTAMPAAPLHVVGNLIVEASAVTRIEAGEIELGYGTTASGWYGATAIGFGTTASGWGSTAMGEFTLASGDGATAMGSSTKATGGDAVAMGVSSLASGYNSTAMGNYTTASGSFSTAMGSGTMATGDYSFASGIGTRARSYAETVVGVDNDDYAPQSTNSFDLSDRLFVVGCGFSGFHLNALTVLKNGFVGLTVTSPSYLLDLYPRGGPAGSGRASAWVTYSDSRLKDSIEVIPYGLNAVMDLKPRTYIQHAGTFSNGRVKLEPEGQRQIGFIAQEAISVVPEAVQLPADESKDFWSLDYQKLIPVLTKAIQELKTENDELRRRLDALELKIGPASKGTSSEGTDAAIKAR